MKRALILGASGGIGTALAKTLDDRGWEVTGLSRSTEGLDITDEVSVASALDPLHGTFDLIFVATGALVINGHEPEKAVRQMTAPGLADQFAVNAVGPALILKHSLRLIPKDRPSTFAVLSARVGSIGDNRLGGWHSYRAAKAALNQLMHGAAIELARTHKAATVLCLHPGTVETAFTEKYAASHSTVSPSEAADNLLAVIARLGPEASGQFFDWAGKRIPW